MNSYSQVSRSREVSLFSDSSGYELARGPCTVKAGRERGIVDAIRSWTCCTEFLNSRARDCDVAGSVRGAFQGRGNGP